MVSKIVYLAVLSAFCGLALSETCQNPKVNAASFTSQDSTVLTQIAYITEFTLSCDNKLPENYALYAEVDGKSLTAARTGPNKYQVSWTEDVATARSGTRQVSILDEAGWADVRRARRADPNAAASPLVAIQLHHPGIYSGPWVNSEVMATVLSIVVAYVAIRNKAKILA